MSKPHFNLVCLLGLARWDGRPNGFGLNIFFLLLVVVVPPLSLSSQQTQDRSPAAFRCCFRFDSIRVESLLLLLLLLLLLESLQEMRRPLGATLSCWQPFPKNKNSTELAFSVSFLLDTPLLYILHQKKNYVVIYLYLKNHFK